MPKRKRGGTTSKAKGGRPSRNNSSSNSSNNEEEEESYPHLRALLSLQVPTCCANCDSGSGLDLIALPQCACATTLASTHVNVDALPPPPAEDAAGGSESVSIYLKRLAKSQPCCGTTTTTTAAARGGFTPRKPPIRVFKKLAMCRPCLSEWAASSDDVETYDYNGDPNSNETKFSVDVKCPQCGIRITRRAVQNLLGNARAGTTTTSSSTSSTTTSSSQDDEWRKCVTKTTDIVSWGNKLKKWVKKELRHAENDASSSSDDLTSEEVQLRDALLSEVPGSDDDDGPVRRQEVKRYELKEYLMEKDVRFRQDVEGEEAALALNEKIRREAEAEEEEQRRRLEEDERMARELAEEEKKRKASSSSAGHGGVTMNERDRAEDEKKSEEAARILQEQLLKQDEEEKRLREERDAAYAKELQEKEKGEQRKRRKSSLSPGCTVRKSPFDGGTKTCTKSRGSFVVKDDETDENKDNSSGVGVQNMTAIGVSVPDQTNDKYEDEHPATSPQSTNTTRTPVREEADVVYEIESSDEEDDRDEKNTPFPSQAVSSPQKGISLSHELSTASPAASAPAATGSQVTKPSSLSRDDMDDTDDTAPINDEKQSWSDENERHIDTLVAMGFGRDEARLRYIDAFRNVERAATMLLSASEARQRAKEEAKKMPQLSS